MKHDHIFTSFQFVYILKNAWYLFWKNINAILLVVLIANLPFVVLNNLDPVSSVYDEYGVFTAGFYDLLLSCLGILFLILKDVCIVVILDNHKSNEKKTISEFIKVSFSYWEKSVTTDFLKILILIGLTLLFVVPGVIAAVHYVFSTFVVVTKDIAGKSALNYSKRIVHGRWWFVFGNLLLIFIIAIIIWLPFYILFRMLPELNTLDRIMSYIINGLLGAFGTVMYFVLFTKLDEGQEIQAQEGAMAPNLSST